MRLVCKLNLHVEHWLLRKHVGDLWRVKIDRRVGVETFNNCARLKYWGKRVFANVLVCSKRHLLLTNTKQMHIRHEHMMSALQPVPLVERITTRIQPIILKGGIGR